MIKALNAPMRMSKRSLDFNATAIVMLIPETPKANKKRAEKAIRKFNGLAKPITSNAIAISGPTKIKLRIPPPIDLPNTSSLLETGRLKRYSKTPCSASSKISYPMNTEAEKSIIITTPAI